MELTKEEIISFETLSNELKKYEDALKNSEDNLQETLFIQESLKDIEELKEGDEILAPVFNGVFIKAKIVDTKKLKVNVGKDIVATRSIDEVKEMIESQKKDMEIYRTKLIDAFNRTYDKLKELEDKINKKYKV